MLATNVAINTILVYTLSLAVSLLSTGIFGFRSFPELGFRHGQHGHDQSYVSGPAAASRGTGLLRMRALFAGSILMVIDSINNLVLHVQVWRTGEANFVVYQLLRVFFVPAGTLFVIAMAHRIALLAVMRPRWKRRFLWTVCGFAIYAAVQQCTLLVISVLGKLDLTSDEWLQAVVFPEWSAYTMVLLPIFCIAGSIWSLRIAFGANSQLSTTSSGADSRGVGECSGCGSGSLVQQPSAGHAVLTGQPIRYSLTWVFKALTCLVMIYWTLFLIILGNQHPNLPIRVGSLSSLINSLCLITEGSFEWLLKRETRRRRIRQRLVSLDAGIQLESVGKSGSQRQCRGGIMSPTPSLVVTIESVGSPCQHPSHLDSCMTESSASSANRLADMA